ncbi:phage tail protein [Mucilaginibacter lacusdianchii]|uniref:phage tail protein n=1 Tax=Mucilaginibacter lacusdianchii TaxID=2684211 RepID=UPI00131C2271|nr:tail fiber protein [Mucilaginibacter sp. JXJ CY 39]
MDAYLSEIRIFAGNFAPQNFAICNGAAININQNTALYALLGTTFGGDGKTTFELPNFQGRVAIGAGAGFGLTSFNPGATVGEETYVLSMNTLSNHTHPVGSSSPLTVTLNGPITATMAVEDGAGSSDTPVGGFLAQEGSSSGLYADAPTDKAALNSASIALDMQALTVDYGSMTTALAGSPSPQPVSNLQPFLVLNYIMCVSGFFPSRN